LDTYMPYQYKYTDIQCIKWYIILFDIN